MDIAELLMSPLRLEPRGALPLPLDLLGPSRCNSVGVDLTVQTMARPLLAAYSQAGLPTVPEFDVKKPVLSFI